MGKGLFTKNHFETDDNNDKWYIFFPKYKQYKFAMITMGRAEYINEDDAGINLSDFKNSSNNQRMYSLLHFLSSNWIEWLKDNSIISNLYIQ